MKDIEPVSAYGPIVEKDVADILRGLPPGQRYAASDLYERYAEFVTADGRTPGHPVALGQTFKRMGLTRTKMTRGGGGTGHTGRGRQVVAWIV